MLKKRFFTLISLSCFIITFMCPVVHAADEWESFFRDLTDGVIIKPGVPQKESVYGADVAFTITNNNGIINDFDGTDTVNLSVAGNGEALSFNGNKDSLIDWAYKNKDTLMKAVFGNAPDASIGGITNSQMITQNLFSATLGSPENFGVTFVPVSNRDIVVKAQYDFMDINNADATGGSGMLTYDHKFGTDNDKSIGITIPFRQLDIDDKLDSKYNNISFVPNFKKRWYMTQSMTEMTVHANIGLTYLESSLFPDGGGFMDYGFGTNVKYAYAINDQISINAGLGYQILKREIPSSLVPKELKWISEAFQDLDPEHSLTPSIGVFYSIIPNKFSFRYELFRIHQIAGDAISDYENQTVMLGIFSFNITDKIRSSLGYKRSFEMEDITDQSLIVDLKIRW